MANKEDKDTTKRIHPLCNKFIPAMGCPSIFNNQIQYPFTINPDRTAFEAYPHLNYLSKTGISEPKDYALIESYHRTLAAQSDGQAFFILPNQLNNIDGTTTVRGDSPNTDRAQADAKVSKR